MHRSSATQTKACALVGMYQSKVPPYCAKNTDLNTANRSAEDVHFFQAKCNDVTEEEKIDAFMK